MESAGGSSCASDMPTAAVECPSNGLGAGSPDVCESGTNASGADKNTEATEAEREAAAQDIIQRALQKVKDVSESAPRSLTLPTVSAASRRQLQLSAVRGGKINKRKRKDPMRSLKYRSEQSKSDRPTATGTNHNTFQWQRLKPLLTPPRVKTKENGSPAQPVVIQPQVEQVRSSEHSNVIDFRSVTRPPENPFPPARPLVLPSFSSPPRSLTLPTRPARPITIAPELPPVRFDFAAGFDVMSFSQRFPSTIYRFERPPLRPLQPALSRPIIPTLLPAPQNPFVTQAHNLPAMPALRLAMPHRSASTESVHREKNSDKSRPASRSSCSSALTSRSDATDAGNEARMLDLMWNDDVGEQLLKKKFASFQAKADDLPEQKTHKCLACGDVFLFESSLVEHRDRKTMKIVYHCPEGCGKQVFFNRCALFAHAKQHVRGSQVCKLHTSNVAISLFTDHSARAILNKALKTCMREAGVQPHTCSVCSEGFSSAEQLSAHQERTSAKVEHLCDSKGVSRRFANRCAAAIWKAQHPTNGTCVCEVSTVSDPLPRDSDVTFDADTSQDDVASPFTSKRSSKPNSTPNSSSVNTIPPKSPTPGTAATPIEILDSPLKQLQRKARDSSESAAMQLNFPVLRGASGVLSVLCEECKTDFDSVEALRLHLNPNIVGSPDDAPSVSLCGQCQHPLTSKCAEAAHARLHSLQSPFVCPDCGQSQFETPAVLAEHVNSQCFHWNRSLMARCPHCLVMLRFMSSTLRMHFLSNHFEASQSVLCGHCRAHIQSERALLQHSRAYHPELPVLSFPLVVCVPCKQMIRDMHKTQHFLDKHEAELNCCVICTYKCTLCARPKIFQSKPSFKQHLETVHKQMLVAANCSRCGLQFGSLAEFHQHIRNAHADILKQTATVGRRRSHDMGVRQAESEDVAQETSGANQDNNSRIQKLLIKKVSRSVDGSNNGQFQIVVTSRRSSTSPSVLLTQRSEASSLVSGGSPVTVVEESTRKKVQLKEAVVRMKKQFICQVPTAPAPVARFVCALCNARLRTPQSLLEHMTSVHDEKPHLPCHLCSNTYDSKQALLKHVSAAHEGKNGKHAHMCWKCLEQGTVKGFATWKMLERHLTTTHKMRKSHIDYSKRLKAEDVESDANADAKRSGDSAAASDQPIKRFVPLFSTVKLLYSQTCNFWRDVFRLKTVDSSEFVCAKCSFRCDERSAFSTHIAKHRSRENHWRQLSACAICRLATHCSAFQATAICSAPSAVAASQCCPLSSATSASCTR